jgi:hypothetical protein
MKYEFNNIETTEMIAIPPSAIRSVYTVAQDIDLLHAFCEGALGLKLAFRDRDRWCQFKAARSPSR